MVLAGSPEVLKTRDRAFTDVSPVLAASTAAYERWYIDGTVASARIIFFSYQDREDIATVVFTYNCAEYRWGRLWCRSGCWRWRSTPGVEAVVIHRIGERVIIDEAASKAVGGRPSVPLSRTRGVEHDRGYEEAACTCSVQIRLDAL